jgi:alpha-mannosidase
VSEYADALLASHPVLPEHHGESERVFEGTYLSHADSKRLNRASENELVAAGTLAALAGVDAAAGLSAAWRDVLHHQFHDILGGSAVAGAYRDQERDAESVRDFAADLSRRSLDVLLAGTTAGSLVVSNLLGADRTDVVVMPRAIAGERGGLVDDSGAPVSTQRTSEGDLVFVAGVDAFGHREYRFDPTARPDAPDMRVTPMHDGAAFLVENRFFRAELRADSGIVTSLVATDSGRVVVGRNPSSPESTRQHRAELGLGALVLGHERHHPMSSWVQDELDSERTLLGTGTTTIAELGPVRVVFESTHEFGVSRAIVRTILYAELPWLDYEIAVDWNEPGSPETGIPSLAVSFASRLPAHDFWTETPFSAVRHEPDGFLAPMLRWADLDSAEGGLLVANDGKYGADALGPRLRIPLVRSAYDPDPTSDRGRLDTSRFRVHPHAGRWQDTDAVTIAAGLNLPLRVSSPLGNRRAAAGIRPHLVDSGSVRIAGLEPVDGRIEARLYESAGVARTAILSGLPPHSAVTECTIVGDPVAEHRADADGRVSLAFGEFQVMTLRFPRSHESAR